MDFHPYADVWPLMEGAPFNKLVADIKANGLQLPILTYDGRILDGRNRYRACVEAGVEPRFEAAKVKTDKEALLLSASMNEVRRHMSKTELGLVSAKMATFTHGGNRRSPEGSFKYSNEYLNDKKPLLTQREAASKVGVSRGQLIRAHAVLTHAPDLENDVVTKKISLQEASEIAWKRGSEKKAAEKVKQDQRKAKHPSVSRRPKTLQALTASNQTKLTKAMVDPEWTGTDFEWVLEYGHVQIQTSEQRSTSRLSSWAIGIGYTARILKEQELPKITDRVLHWLRSPSQRDADKLRAAVADLDIALTTAKRLLASIDEQAEKERQRA